MSDESWARVSLRVTSPHLGTDQLATLLGRKSVDGPDNPWSIDLVEDSSVPLDDQLRTAKEFLSERIEVLEGLAGGVIDMLVGWTPRSPQDGIALDPELLGLLARSRCCVRLDTFVD